MTTEWPAARVDELVTAYGAANASAATLLCDRHPPSSTAFTVVAADLRARTVTFGELRDRSERLAAGLRSLDIGPGDRVATLMGKRPELVTTLLAIWRVGAVHVPLFTAFAPQGIAVRLQDSAAKAVVCDRAQRSKLDPGDDIPADAPWRIIVVDGDRPASDLTLGDLIGEHPAGRGASALGGDAPLIHIFTSGTTGGPKGVVVPTRALAAFHAYMEFGLDVRPDDVFWCAPAGRTACTTP